MLSYVYIYMNMNSYEYMMDFFLFFSVYGG